MGKVVYMMNVSLDGYVETPDRSWTGRSSTTSCTRGSTNESVESEVDVYGRRLWEVMAAYWPTGESNPASTGPIREFARIWNAT